MSDSKSGMRWYIVHTMSNYEKKAGDSIKLRSKEPCFLKKIISIELLKKIRVEM